MTFFEGILNFTNSLYAGWTSSVVIGVGGLAVLVFLTASLLCFVAAFVGIEKPTLRVAFSAVSGAVLFSLVLGAVLNAQAPALASELDPGLLFGICALAGFLVFAVPLMQAFWRTDYLRASSSFLFALAIVAAIGWGLNELGSPAQAQVARPVIDVIE